MIKIFKSKKNIALLCTLLAAVIAIVCIASAGHGGFSKGNSSDYDVSSLTLNDDSVMKDDTIVFVGSDFTLGLKADNQSFIDYLRAVDGLNAATFTEENIGLTSKKDVSFISLVESIPKEHASPKAIFCEIPYYDAKHSTKLGEISDSYMLSDFDTETAIGAMEYIMCYAKMNWSCPVFFYTSADYNSSKKYEKLVSAARRVSDKWNMPMLDFTSNDKIASLEKSDKSLYFVDSRNMTKAGYNEIVAPEFENFITQNLYS